jgi:hypothetical protein
VTERQKATLKWALTQALAEANRAVEVYTQDKEYTLAEQFAADAKDLVELIKQLT